MLSAFFSYNVAFERKSCSISYLASSRCKQTLRSESFDSIVSKAWAAAKKGLYTFPLADYFRRGIPVFQIRMLPSMIRSGSANRLLAIMARSRTLRASTLRSKSSCCLWRVLSFIPVFVLTPGEGFLRSNSALTYSLQTLARRLPYLARATTAQAPSAY